MCAAPMCITLKALLAGRENENIRKRASAAQMFEHGSIHLRTNPHSRKADLVTCHAGEGRDYSLPQIMAMDVNGALEVSPRWKNVNEHLEVLKNPGLGYLTLGEATPGLSGGEAQRLKLASEMGKMQTDTVFVFDEPTIGLHPLDVLTLLKVFENLVDKGATVIVIEHDLFFIRNADYVIDMGPGGGEARGTVVGAGTPEQIAANSRSVTGKFIAGDIRYSGK